MAKIIVGYDGTEPAQAAVDVAAGLARTRGDDLLLVWVIDERAEIREAGSAWSDPELTKARADRIEGIEGVAADDLAATAAAIRDVAVTTSVVAGHPAQALIGIADEQKADLLVIGHRNVTGLSRFLGRVGNEVVNGASCHVLIAKSD